PPHPLLPLLVRQPATGTPLVHRCAEPPGPAPAPVRSILDKHILRRGRRRRLQRVVVASRDPARLYRRHNRVIPRARADGASRLKLRSPSPSVSIGLTTGAEPRAAATGSHKRMGAAAPTRCLPAARPPTRTTSEGLGLCIAPIDRHAFEPARVPR